MRDEYFPEKSTGWEVKPFADGDHNQMQKRIQCEAYESATLDLKGAQVTCVVPRHRPVDQRPQGADTSADAPWKGNILKGCTVLSKT